MAPELEKSLQKANIALTHAKIRSARKQMVFIYQPGKVGSSSVNFMVSNIIGAENVVHLHFLSEDFKKRAYLDTTCSWHIKQIKKAEKLIEKPKKPNKDHFSGSRPNK